MYHDLSAPLGTRLRAAEDVVFFASPINFVRWAPVDTGPILWADLERPEDRMIRRCQVGHICYNGFDLAEVIVRESIPVVYEGYAASVADYRGTVHRVQAHTTIMAAPAA